MVPICTHHLVNMIGNARGMTYIYIYIYYGVSHEDRDFDQLSELNFGLNSRVLFG